MWVEMCIRDRNKTESAPGRQIALRGRCVLILIDQLSRRLSSTALTTSLSLIHICITSTRKGSITSVQAVYVPADDLTDPAPATTEIYTGEDTLSLHDALPICGLPVVAVDDVGGKVDVEQGLQHCAGEEGEALAVVVEAVEAAALEVICLLYTSGGRCVRLHPHERHLHHRRPDLP